MFDLCKKGDLENLKPLLEVSEDKNPKNPNAGQNETLLHQAAGKGHLEIVKFLVPLLLSQSIVDARKPSKKPSSNLTLTRRFIEGQI